MTTIRKSAIRAQRRRERLDAIGAGLAVLLVFVLAAGAETWADWLLGALSI